MSQHDYKTARAVAIANALEPDTIAELVDTLRFLKKFSPLDAGDMAQVTAVLKLVDLDLDSEAQRYQTAGAQSCA